MLEVRRLISAFAAVVYVLLSVWLLLIRVLAAIQYRES